MTGPGSWTAWELHPAVLAGIGAAAACYGIGLRTLWRRAGSGRGISHRRAAAGGAGLAVLLLALVSPIDALGHALFSAHMVQHLLLLVVAPPLLVAGAPLYVGFWALPRRSRRRLGDWWHRARRGRRAARAALRPLPVWLTNVVILWFWHLPAAYDLAVRIEPIHALEHASFLVAAFLFWWLPFRHAGRRMDRGAGIIYVFTAGLQCSALGAILTFSGSAWYAVHAHTTAALGLSPLQDQQLAGLIMWIPAAVVYLGAAALLFLQWLERAGARRDVPLTGSVRVGSMRIAPGRPSGHSGQGRGRPDHHHLRGRSACRSS